MIQSALTEHYAQQYSQMISEIFSPTKFPSPKFSLGIKNPVFFKTGQIWIKDGLKSYKNSSDSNRIYYRFMKSGKTFGKEVERYAFLENGHIFYSQTPCSKNIKGYLDLQNLYLKEEIFENRHRIILSNVSKIVELDFLKDDFLIEQGQQLRKHVIQTGYKIKYQLEKDLSSCKGLEVIQVKDRKSGKKYAAKMIPKYRKAMESNKFKVANEKRNLIKINSTYVDKFVEFFQEEDEYILIFDLFVGKNFQEFFKKGNTVSFLTLIKILKGIFLGLSHIHAQNIIHRDIKPKNIIINSQNYQPKIINFGLSLQVSDNLPLTQYKRCGTMGYIAHEVMQNGSKSKKPYTVKADIFSVGVIVYTILMGDSPTRGNDYHQTFRMSYQHQLKLDNKKIIQLYGLSGSQFLAGLLEKDPKKRLSATEALNSKFLAEYDSIVYEIIPKTDSKGTAINEFSDEENSDEIPTPINPYIHSYIEPLHSKLESFKNFFSKHDQKHTMSDEFESDEDQEEEIPTPLFSSHAKKINSNSYV